MKTYNNIHSFILKLQNLPETKKKIIFISVIVVSVLIIGFFEVISTKNNIQKIGQSIKSINLPKIEIPQDSMDGFQNITDVVSGSDSGIIQNSNQEQAKNSNWKTYTNEKYGYQIDYPSNWTFREYSDVENGAAFRPIDKPDQIDYELIDVDDFSRGLDYCNIPFLDYVKTAFAKEAGDGNQTLKSIEKIVNDNGVETYKTTWEYYTDAGKKVISLPITYFASNAKDCTSPQAHLRNKNYIDIYNQMIKSFKFTNTNQ